MPGKEEGKITDGRRLRAERSKAAIAQALFDLVSEGDIQPTAANIAKRAGVSPRLVFHHYPDMEAIYIELIHRQFHRLLPMLELKTTPEDPFDERLRHFVTRRVKLLEFVTPTRRAASMVAVYSKLVADSLAIVREFKRDQTAQVFAPELERFSGAEAEERKRSLASAASWMNWEGLRTHQGLSRARATRVMERMIRCVLDPGSLKA